VSESLTLNVDTRMPFAFNDTVILFIKIRPGSDWKKNPGFKVF